MELEKLRPDVKEKWVAALRSGNYQQGKDSLRSSSNEFCCLGVLCDVAVEEGVIPEPENPGVGYDYAYGVVPEGGDPSPFGGYNYVSEIHLPQAVIEWAGLESRNPLVPHPGDDQNAEGWAVALSDLNDTGQPFNVIARIIEEHL